MGLNVGNLPVQQVYVGSTRVRSVYVGSDRIWSDTVQITLGSGYESRDQLLAALSDRGLDYTKVTEIPFEIDLVGSGSAQGMFFGCSALTTVPEMDTGNVTNMAGMFDQCSALTTVPEMDTSNVTNMSGMFGGCSSLTTVPEMDTSNVTNMYSMFYNCSSLTTVPDMDTSDVENMSYMFRGCSSLTQVPAMETWEVSDMSYMFSMCSSLTSVPSMGTSKVTDMNYMFYNCSSLTDGKAILYGRRPDVNTGSDMITNSGLTYLPFYTEVVKIPKATGNSTTARDAFRAALTARRLNHRTITYLPFKIELTGSGNSVFDLFAYCEKLTSVPSIPLPGVTSTRGMFNHCTALTSVGDLQTSNVTNTMYMFWNCPSLTDGNVRLIGRHPNVVTDVMISGSGLTYLPFNTEVSSVTLTKVYGANRVHPLLSVTVPAGKTWSVRIQGTVTLADYEGSGYPIFRIASANSRSYWQGASVDFSGTVSAANSTIAMVTQSSENTSFSGTVTIER